MPLKESRIFYKPFEYPWAYDAWLTQQKLHWLPYEVTFADDIKDWRSSLSSNERNLLTHILRFFTQSDMEVGECYMQEYTKVFKAPEIARMLTAFSNMETIHQDGYACLIDTLGFPDAQYQEFFSIKEMRAKYDFLGQFNCDTDYDTAKTLAVFGALTEGLMLFSSFAILLNPQRFGKLKGVGQIVAWSARDETLHTVSIIKLYHTFLQENPHVDMHKLHEDIVQKCKEVVILEDEFLDLAYEAGDVEGLVKEDVKLYIRYIANYRMQQLHIPVKLYNVDHNPLPWLDEILNGQEFTNFFENKATEYAKASMKGEWDEAFG